MAESSRMRKPTTRRRVSSLEEIDLRPTAPDGSRPPRLELGLRQRLKMLLLANILPMGTMILLTMLWWDGTVRFTIDEHRLMASVLIIFASLIVIAISFWALLPFSVWLRAYPRWHYRHISKTVWLLPLCGGYLLWLVIWLLVAFLTAFSLLVILTGILYLLGQNGGA